MAMKEKEDELVDEFNTFSDWTEKYEYLIDLGKDLPVLDPLFKNDKYKIKGCQSQVWLKADFDGQKLHFQADSDAIITKGIIALLIRVYNDEKPEDIIASDAAFLDKIGLKQHLSPTRSNGLLQMLKQMKYFALAAGGAI